LRYPIFDAFDRPDANASCGRRNESTTATQSLLMLNSEQSLEAARKLAYICLDKSNGAPMEAANVAFAKCFGRQMDPTETEVVQRFLLHDQDATVAESITDVCLGFFNTSEFIYVD
jgi:hypothetical protein